jgi:hypothetical protein
MSLKSLAMTTKTCSKKKSFKKWEIHGEDTRHGKLKCTRHNQKNSRHQK